VELVADSAGALIPTGTQTGIAMGVGRDSAPALSGSNIVRACGNNLSSNNKIQDKRTALER
jgi:uncharacterized protein YfiM (DUF2279 family)